MRKTNIASTAHSKSNFTYVFHRDIDPKRKEDDRAEIAVGLLTRQDCKPSLYYRSNIHNVPRPPSEESTFRPATGIAVPRSSATKQYGQICYR